MQGDKRQQIMQAAERLFTSRRLHEITLDDVARLAKVGKGTIYSHFQDKDDLFFQTATRGFDELCDLLGRHVREDSPFALQLTEACRQISGFFQHRRQLLRMMQVEDGRMQWCPAGVRQRWSQRRKNLVAAMSAILAKGIAEGAIVDDLPPAVLAALLLGLLRTRARDLSDELPGEEGLKRIVEFFTHGASGRLRIDL